MRSGLATGVRVSDEQALAEVEQLTSCVRALLADAEAATRAADETHARVQMLNARVDAELGRLDEVRTARLEVQESSAQAAAAVRKAEALVVQSSAEVDRQLEATARAAQRASATLEGVESVFAKIGAEEQRTTQRFEHYAAELEQIQGRSETAAEVAERLLREATERLDRLQRSREKATKLARTTAEAADRAESARDEVRAESQELRWFLESIRADLDEQTDAHRQATTNLVAARASLRRFALVAQLAAGVAVIFALVSLLRPLLD